MELKQKQTETETQMKAEENERIYHEMHKKFLMEREKLIARENDANKARVPR